MDHTLLVVSGELDLATAPQLSRALDAASSEGPATVHLDLSGITFIDCAGLQALVLGRRAARGRGRDLLVRRTSRRVDRLCSLTGERFEAVGQ
jgi:anti-sigma B factor antagonist